MGVVWLVQRPLFDWGQLCDSVGTAASNTWQAMRQPAPVPNHDAINMQSLRRQTSNVLSHASSV